MKVKIFFFFCFALLLSLTVLVIAADVPGSIDNLKINEIVSNPFSGGNEWVEIYNDGMGSVNLTGCKVVDLLGNGPSFANGTSISSNGFIAIDFSGSVLNNAGDTVSLICSNSTIDSVGFGDEGDAPNPANNKSIGRCSNGDDTNNDASDFEIFNTLTKGSANACSTQFGCIAVTKHTVDLAGNPITPVPQFSFLLNSGQQIAYSNSLGQATFNNVPTGLNTVSENIPFGWLLTNVSPAGGNVFVNTGSSCSTVTFWNLQNLNGSGNPVCGNGVLELGEVCDDGNLINGDGCSSQCTVEPFCGDGNLDLGEQCDDGNNLNGDGCSNICNTEQQIPVCGNGIKETGEFCDDGNINNNDLCNNQCQATFCGDGFLNPGEGCDDGNNLNGDGCSTICLIESPTPRCGDGIINQPSEQCDGGSSCTQNCKIKNTDNGITPHITTEQFPPLVWLCDNRVVYDDNTEPGRISGPGQPLVERINNYAFEGEQISWTVLVMDKNKIDQNIDVYGTVGSVQQGEGNPIEVNCQRVGSQRNFDSCNARILEEELTFNPDTMAFFECTLTVETPTSMHGEYWITVEAQDGEGNLGTFDENEYWFLNPQISLSIDGSLSFDDVRPGTSGYSSTLLLGNGAEEGSGVMLDMFITGTDFYDSGSSGARCPNTNQLSLSNFRYFATNGGYSTSGIYPGAYLGPTADSEGYKGITYGTGFNNPNPFYNKAEILPKQIVGPYYTANLLAPGSEMALTFRLDMPEPCNGDFDSGNIYFWGEAV